MKAIYVNADIQIAPSGIRTHTPIARERILSPVRLPFRHEGQRRHSTIPPADLPWALMQMDGYFGSVHAMNRSSVGRPPSVGSLPPAGDLEPELNRGLAIALPEKTDAPHPVQWREAISYDRPRGACRPGRSPPAGAAVSLSLFPNR